MIAHVSTSLRPVCSRAANLQRAGGATSMLGGKLVIVGTAMPKCVRICSFEIYKNICMIVGHPAVDIWKTRRGRDAVFLDKCKAML